MNIYIVKPFVFGSINSHYTDFSHRCNLYFDNAHTQSHTHSFKKINKKQRHLLQHLPAESYPLYSSLCNPFTNVSKIYFRLLGTPQFKYAKIPKKKACKLYMWNNYFFNNSTVKGISKINNLADAFIFSIIVCVYIFSFQFQGLRFILSSSTYCM